MDQPDWAGVALRFPGNKITTFQLSWPEVVIEATYEDRPFHGYREAIYKQAGYAFHIRGLAGFWQQDEGGLHVPVAEIKARRGIES